MLGRGSWFTVGRKIFGKFTGSYRGIQMASLSLSLLHSVYTRRFLLARLSPKRLRTPCPLAELAPVSLYVRSPRLLPHPREQRQRWQSSLRAPSPSRTYYTTTNPALSLSLFSRFLSLFLSHTRSFPKRADSTKTTPQLLPEDRYTLGNNPTACRTKV